MAEMEFPEKNPEDSLQKMLRTKARKFKPQQRLKPKSLVAG